MIDLKTLTHKVIQIAKEVGGFIKNEATHSDTNKIEYKGLNDLVSYVDKTAEEKIVKQLSNLILDAGFITEEGTSKKTSENYTWIIDPLDGTTNFIHGLPTFSISIALQHKNQLVLGVVFEINRDECFYAWQGGGAYLNEKPIKVSNNKELSQTLLATGFPYYDFRKQDSYLVVFKEIMQQCHGLRRIGSAAVDLAYVACGRFDGYFEYNLKPYDMAAGIVLVKEAGGKVSNFSGKDDLLNMGGVIAANDYILPDLQEIIKKHFQN